MAEIQSHKPLKPIQTSRNGERSIINNDDGQPLSPLAHVFHEPGSNLYVIGIFGSKTKINPEEAKPKLVNGLLKHPRFSSLQVFDKESGKLKWKATELNVDDHIVVPKLDQNMDSPDKFVEDYICNLTKSDVDKTKPLWDLHILDIKTSDSEGVIVYRVHHSIGDGTSLMALLLACSRKVSDPEALPSIPVMKNSSLLKKLGFWSVLQLVWNTIIGVLLYVATALFLKDSESPIKASKRVEKNGRRIIVRNVSLDDVKLIKNAMNVTINDVVLGVSEAGLTKYLNRRYGEIIDKEPSEEKNYLPKNLRLRAIFYVNLRPFGGIKAFSDMMEKGNPVRWGNNIGYVLFPFKIGFREDPLDYVREAKVAIDRKKSSLEPFWVAFLSTNLIKFFGNKVAGYLHYKVFSNTTLWFSNVPGTGDEIAFCGHEISYYAPTCYGQPNALMIHAVSYVNKLIFIISAEEETIPDPHQICDDLEESLNLIKAAVLAKQHVKDD
ncbi:O-acyltransferase WSD1 [Camellia lanceoleosa]|uniref:O-acyltransferase WSD1 n=1 Tax=Camellia lanceoleosa TaxID=1840588 RepID=A0ACC0HY63_9ERIC|nr:O-acyltransferase WSD1 [Camellia lanceoleosa]